MEIGAHFWDPAGGPKIEVTRTGVDFVFVFQEDTFYPLTRRQEDSNFKPKWVNM